MLDNAILQKPNVKIINLKIAPNPAAEDEGSVLPLEALKEIISNFDFTLSEMGYLLEMETE